MKVRHQKPGAVLRLEDGFPVAFEVARPECVGCPIAVVDGRCVHDALTARLGVVAEITRAMNRAKAARRETERWLTSGGADEVAACWH